MDTDQKAILEKIAGAIRQLSIEAVEKANSGHPGLPLGCAELGAYLYGQLLRHNPRDPEWAGRDRLILSAGHGSMWLYSCLHLAGFDLSLSDIKAFRQWHSKTPGHPEYHETPGVEATTGPLGQGVGNAVGQALALKIAAATFNKDDKPLFTNKVYCLAGDGCLMEGVSSEVSAFAGHIGLDNLVLIFDSNNVTLDGPLRDCGSENTAERYRAYGWDVVEIDGHDFDEIDIAFAKIAKSQHKPTLVIAHTIIGKGSPHKAGTHKVHGSPLGHDELAETKRALGLPEEPFYIPQVVVDYFAKRIESQESMQREWEGHYSAWSERYPDLAKRYGAMYARELPQGLEEELASLEIEGPIAGRSASQAVLSHIADRMPSLYGGSADLSGSDSTMMKQFGLISRGDFSGRNIKYGVREFGMATIASGLFQSGLILPFVGTFLTFSDYMRNAVRLAALSHYRVVYQFTHDSIFLGEDGPTHQPVEHYAALRAIPNLHVIRPADAWEVRGAWLAALEYNGPTAILLSRQKLPILDETSRSYAEGVAKGAYVVKAEATPDFTLIATGSELALALDVAKALEKHTKRVRVISMPCWELFEKQEESYQRDVLGPKESVHVSIEAGVSLGWHKWIGADGVAIAIDSFGASAPLSDMQREYGFTVDAILERLLGR
jgi:transketolase